MPPAVIGGVIAGGASILGGVLGGDAQSDAIDNASDAQARAAAQALQFQREARDQNVQYQTPLYNSGMAANAQINALLGLNVPQTPAPTPTTPTGTQTGAAPSGGNVSGFGQNLLLHGWQQRLASGDVTFEQLPEWVQARLGSQNPSSAPGPAPAATVTQPTAQAAYDAFKNYTGYTNRLQEGQNAINSGYAAKGSLQSGAALQALQEHGQQFASNEFGNYMGYLGGQQNLATGAANALSGVATNYANNAANISMNQGNNLANAAIAQGNNTANMWGNIMGGIGGIAGSIFPGSSFPSDRRLKMDIEKVGEEPDGLGIYEYRYSFDPTGTRYRGVMADEVKELRPRAYIENWRDGYAGVNYAELEAA